MRIAQIAPIIERVPPKKYGGTERVVWTLTEELVKKGHEVTLFATGDSKTSARLVSVYPQSLREASIKNLYGSNPTSLLHIGNAYNMAKEFDIIHDHINLLSMPAAETSPTPVVMTAHNAFEEPDITALFEKLTNPCLVSISNTQRKSAENLNWVGTVYNGLNMEHYPFSAKIGDYLLYVGRISVQKGTHIAIRVAEKLKMKLVIAAKLDTANELDLKYFRRYVKPKLRNPNIRWIGEVDEKQRNDLMKDALCLIHPVTWPEPFGLVMIEAMACGCPVAALDKGSIPEVVLHGQTGFVAKNEKELLESIAKIDKINRGWCREYALARFSGAHMASEYEKIYDQVLKI